MCNLVLVQTVTPYPTFGSKQYALLDNPTNFFLKLKKRKKLKP